MQIVDANIILRYLLMDNEELSEQAAQIIDNYQVDLPIEVLCEVVYVLEKVYGVERKEIYSELSTFLCDADIVLPCHEAVMLGLKYYGTNKLDFVDCVLAGYGNTENAVIYTFDKDLKKLLKRQSLGNPAYSDQAPGYR
jgi:predicted nucleic-acid-binding protein